MNYFKNSLAQIVYIDYDIKLKYFTEFHLQFVSFVTLRVNCSETNAFRSQIRTAEETKSSIVIIYSLICLSEMMCLDCK